MIHCTAMYRRLALPHVVAERPILHFGVSTLQPLISASPIRNRPRIGRLARLGRITRLTRGSQRKPCVASSRLSAEVLTKEDQRCNTEIEPRRSLRSLRLCVRQPCRRSALAKSALTLRRHAALLSFFRTAVTPPFRSSTFVSPVSPHPVPDAVPTPPPSRKMHMLHMYRPSPRLIMQMLPMYSSLRGPHRPDSSSAIC